MQTLDDKQGSFRGWAIAQRTVRDEVLERISVLVDLREAERCLEAIYSALDRPAHRARVLVKNRWIGYSPNVSTVAEIESAIEQLPVNEMRELAAWLEQYQATKMADLIATKLSSEEIAEIQEALGEAEFERGEGLSGETIRKQLGIL